MGLTASLDIGSEKIVMALATEDDGKCRLSGIKMIASQGVKNGVITDKSKVKSYISYLLKELGKGKTVDRVNVALPGSVLEVSEHKVNVPLRRKNVKESDLGRAEMKCAELVNGRGMELVELIPVTYSVDKGNRVPNPVGMAGKSLDVRFRVYMAHGEYLDELRRMFSECGVEEVNFFPEAVAYMEALNVYESEKRFALVNLGASHTDVLLFGDGMLLHEAFLPLGTKTIDSDIMNAFRMADVQNARKMKHEHGVAIRSACKNEKVDIPDAKKQVEKRDLAKVIQCRLEELLEGAVYQLQQWRFNEPANEIFLTGGGSRIKDTDALLGKLSGHKVARAKAKGVQAGEDILEAPACLVALGLLLCEHAEPEEDKGGIGDWFKSIFK